MMTDSKVNELVVMEGQRCAGLLELADEASGGV